MIIPLNVDDLFAAYPKAPTPEQVDFARGILADLLSIERKARGCPGFKSLAAVIAGVRIAAINQRLPQAALMLAGLARASRIAREFQESHGDLVRLGANPDDVSIVDVMEYQNKGRDVAKGLPEGVTCCPGDIDPKFAGSPFLPLVSTLGDSEDNQ